MDRKFLEKIKWESYYDDCLSKGLIKYRKGKISEIAVFCDNCKYEKARAVIQEYDEILPNSMIWQTGVSEKIVGFYCPKCKDGWGWGSKMQRDFRTVIWINR